MKIYNRAKDKKWQLLVFVYYSGHGIMRDNNYCVINSPNMWERYFPLEVKLRRLTELPGVLGFLIFDCCRDKPADGENIDAKQPPIVKPIAKPKAAEGEKSSSEDEIKKPFSKKHDFLKRDQGTLISDARNKS